MSKLAEKIRRAARLQAAPLGFGAARAAPEPTMVLAARTADPAKAADLARRGADAVIIDLTRTSGPPPRPALPGDAIAGALVSARSEGESAACKEAGYDFLVFDPDTAAATALLEEDIGYVLVLPAGMDEADVRALEGLGLDAIDVGMIEGALTVRRQLDLRRVFALTRKPLMATVSPDVSAAELQALRDTNIAVVVTTSPESVERLRKTIDALPPRRRRRGEERPMPLVPTAASVGGEEEEDED